MQMMLLATLYAVLTVGVYVVMNWVYVKYRRDFLFPILTSSAIIIITLVLFNIPYETYMTGGKWIDILLGPAIVSLAIPLYKQRDLLKQYLFPIIGGVIVGVFVGMISGVFFAKIFGFPKDIVMSILPKSITTPIAIQITQSLGGYASLSAAFVMIAGFSGILFGRIFLKWIRIDSPTGIGIGFGAAAHALGTSKAIEIGEQEGSMSSVAMTLCAVVGSIIGPIIAWIFYLG
ncbi:LrgB family protein [Sporosarcina sp. HYO08]|uniref:LrgB family protein n=1 Tax=Sporosarcina sp. HYO08 TaxID=1759557 RepID=UPI00079C5B02|nr:LrgB family protein [Sporosarcina sp. HYO08]KXH81964.1 hypothetical protein AU377_06810 [Sporosarcina sp. HYO08]